MHNQKVDANTVEECIEYLSGTGNYMFDDTPSVNQYDLAITTSLGKQLEKGNAFTQKQSTIGLRLVKSYASLLDKRGFDVDAILDGPLFRWPFRTIDKRKSIHIDGEQIVIKSPFIADVVNKVKKRKNPSYHKGTYNAETKEWAFDYNEPNINFLMKLTKGMHFSIDQKIQEDFRKINKIKQNALEYYPLMTKNADSNSYIFNDQTINESDVRRAIMYAKLNGCLAYDDPVVADLKPKQRLVDTVLLGDNRNWYANSNKYSYLEIFSLIPTVDQCIIICSSNDENQLKNIVDNLLLTELLNSDISVMFRFKKKMNNMNNFIKEKGVNEFSPDKKVFIINEKLPKPLVSNDIDPQLILNCLPTQPSHYKLQAWLNNKPTVVHYRGSEPTGLDNCANL